MGFDYYEIDFTDDHGMAVASDDAPHLCLFPGWLREIPTEIKLALQGDAADLLATDHSFDVYSRRLRSIIDANKRLDDDVIWIPAAIAWEGGDYLQYHAPYFSRATEVLDRQRSTFLGEGVFRAVLSRRRIGGRRFFQIADTGRVVLARSVADAIRRSGCTGMHFAGIDAK